VRPLWAVVAAPMGLVVLLGGGFAAQDDTAQASESSAVTAGVNLSAVPALARQMLPFLQQRLDADCPELPALWLLGIWFVEQAVFSAFDLTNPTGSGGGVAYFAHIGGFVFGLLTIRLLATKRKQVPPTSVVY